MLTKYLIILLTISFLFSCRAAEMDINMSDIQVYLIDAKECYVKKESDGHTSALSKILQDIQIDDYVSHHILKPNEIVILFKSNSLPEDKNALSIELDFRLHDKCERIKVYQLVS